MRVTAGIFAIFTVIGYSMASAQSLELLLKDGGSMLKALCAVILLYFCFSFLLGKLSEILKHRRYFERKQPQSAIGRVLDRHAFWSAFLILILAWMPYLAAYYPGIFMGDTGAQISQFFQLPNGTSNYLNLISDTQMINNHHPVLHTVLMGSAVKIGRVLFHSDNLGIFLYTICQYLCTAAAFSAGIAYFKRLKLPIWMQGTVLGVAALYTIIPRYAVLLSKDMLFADAVLIYMIFLSETMRSKGHFLQKKVVCAVFFLIALLMTLLRQNGVYVLFFSFPILILLWKEKKNRLRAVSVFVGAAAVYMLIIHGLYPMISITPGSRREMLSVPFQQTARCVREYGDRITKREKQGINNVLDYNALGEVYEPDFADPVKNTFREDADEQDMKEYFQIWFEMFWKYPRCYLEAFLNQTYGYFYIGDDAGARRARYYEKFSTRCMEERINEKGFAFHHLDKMRPLRKGLEAYSEAVLHTPGISILEASAFYTWMMLFGITYLIQQRRYQYLIFYLPAVSLILTAFASPANGTIYFRYMLPLMFIFPLFAGVTIREGLE